VRGIRVDDGNHGNQGTPSGLRAAGYARARIRDRKGVSRLPVVRWWHPVVSVVVAALVGALTNLATSGWSWSLVTALVALVVVQAVLSVWQARQDHRDRRAARDELLGPLRPPAPTPPLADRQEAGPRQVVHWLTAPFTPTPLWGRTEAKDRLVAWCVARDPAAGVVRVVTGPAGAGKSRLALAVAESLPPGWAAGWAQDDGASLVERIASAGDPTLVLVDDADRLSEVDTLVTRAVRHPDLVRVLLLTRTATGLRSKSDAVLPQLSQVEALGPLGAAGDRQRWFDEATRSYAKAWRVPPPDVSSRPVGRDEDTPLVLHARALLAVLGRAGTHTWSLAELVTELVALECRTWHTDAPPGCDPEVLTQAVTVLLVLPAPTAEDAAELLRRVPQFAHDTAHQARAAVARWARRHYPPGPDHRLDLRPHLVAERLVLDTLTDSPGLLHDDDIPAAAPVLTRAYASFPDALAQLTTLLARRPDLLPDALAAALATGVTDPDFDHALAALVETADADDVLSADVRERLIALAHPEQFLHLDLVRSRLRVEHHRRLERVEPGRHQPDLAHALDRLGGCWGNIGRWREATAAIEEAVAIRRELVRVDPGRHRASLVFSLHNHSRCLLELGRGQEALDIAEELVAYWREQTTAEPEKHRADLAASLRLHGVILWHMQRWHEALATTAEAVDCWRELFAVAPGRYRTHLAAALQAHSASLGDLERWHEALPLAEEAVALYREWVTVDSWEEREELALSLQHLGNILRKVGREREGLAAIEKAVALFRRLFAAEPARYRPNLAESLCSLGNALREGGRVREALTSIEEAVAHQRKLAAAEPTRHQLTLITALHDLAFALEWNDRLPEALAVVEEAVARCRELSGTARGLHREQLGRSLHFLARTLLLSDRAGEALAAAEQSVALFRELVSAEPERHRANFAIDLDLLAATQEQAGDRAGARRTRRELVVVWQACAEQDPARYGSMYRGAVADLQRLEDGDSHDPAALRPIRLRS
jgi:tetratricopeptide (TPR) repeat protein